MKRSIATVLALLLMLTALTACGSPETPAEPASSVAETTEPAAAVPAESLPEAETEPEPSQEVTQDSEALEGEEDSADAEEPEPEAAAIDRDGVYTTKEDVALYLHTYGELPSNFMTKNEARDLGWSGGGLDGYADGMCIGGDRFGNYEGILPDGSYHECDIDTLHANSRGAKRLVYSDDGRIYYTEDHYESFTLLYGEE